MRRDKKAEREIAIERISTLVALAEDAVRAGRQDRADRYADLAWSILTTYRLRGTALRGRTCRKCHAFFTSATRRVRLQAGHRTVTCLKCGHIQRRPLTRPPSRDAPAARRDAPEPATRGPAA